MGRLKIAGATAPNLAPAADLGAPTFSDRDAAGASLSVEPLVAFVRERGRSPYATEADLRAYQRARHRGEITPEEADRLLIGLLGLHPMFVWGEDWWAASSEEAS